MATDRRWKLVCYDVRDPGRWRKVHRIVRGHGTRLQYSVFRCRLDDRATERLRWELAKVMLDVDRLLIVDLCPRCSGRVVSSGADSSWEDDAATFLILGPPTPQAPPEDPLPDKSN